MGGKRKFAALEVKVSYAQRIAKLDASKAFGCSQHRLLRVKWSKHESRECDRLNQRPR